MASPLDLHHVQGDILAGLPKKTQTCFFFRIEDAQVQGFRKQLRQLVPHVTTTAQVMKDLEKIAHHKKKMAERKGNQEYLKMIESEGKATPELLEMSGVNLAFTNTGLKKIGIPDEIGDPTFDKGMLKDAPALGDQVDPNWIPEFTQEIHGLIMITGDCHATVEARLADIKKIFLVGEESATIHEVLSLVGDVRPGSAAGHEHFGYLDGVSQPAVLGVDAKLPLGQETVRQGIVLLGREGDEILAQNKPPTPNKRPSWALDGSFLCFRYLFQRVPEFNAFLKEHALPIPDPGLPHDSELGSELLGARLVGRWKSGAPIDVTPLKDDKALGGDPSRNNNFRYDPNSQERCPFAAHTRKTNPRADLPSTEVHRIIRRGIPYGPEVSKDEAASNRSTQQRGLLFVSYQSSIFNGFQFLQEKWANQPKFPPAKTELPGFDAIIGQSNDPKDPRTAGLSGTNPQDQSTPLKLPIEWVVAKGGEYFFSPSIPALKKTFALTA